MSHHKIKELNCKICDGDTSLLYTKKVLHKHDVKYFQCTNCQFIQTETPYWLDEAYSNGAISALDVGIMQRNIEFSNLTDKILKRIFTKEDRSESLFLDYGGGHGIFVRLMRDLGYQFYRDDKYAPNLFANHFDISDLQPKTKFAVLSAFEVFEHLPNPLESIDEMFELSDILLFSTVLQPENLDENWWYFVPFAGQHVALYHRNSFENFAKERNLNFYTNGKNFHILSKHPINIDLTIDIQPPKLTIAERILNKLAPKENKNKSLISSDFSYVESMLNSKNENSSI